MTHGELIDLSLQGQQADPRFLAGLYKIIDGDVRNCQPIGIELDAYTRDSLSRARCTGGDRQHGNAEGLGDCLVNLDESWLNGRAGRRARPAARLWSSWLHLHVHGANMFAVAQCFETAAQYIVD